MGTYSGGTVRDSHPVVLFSSRGSSPGLPRNFIRLSKVFYHSGCLVSRCFSGHNILYPSKNQGEFLDIFPMGKPL